MSAESEFDCGEDVLEEENLCDYTGEECCGDKMFCEECIVMHGEEDTERDSEIDPEEYPEEPE